MTQFLFILTPTRIYCRAIRKRKVKHQNSYYGKYREKLRQMDGERHGKNGAQMI